MGENIDEFLSSLGITQDKFEIELPGSNITIHPTNTTYNVPTAEEALDIVSSTPTTEADPSVSISEDDVNDILDQFGIGAPMEEPAEEPED